MCTAFAPFAARGTFVYLLDLVGILVVIDHTVEFERNDTFDDVFLVQPFQLAVDLGHQGGDLLLVHLHLFDLVNKCVPGKVRIGKIDLRENFSFFEVEEGEAQRVMDSMNGFEVDGRRISVEPAQGKKEEGGRGGKRSYGGRRSDDGYKGKRGSKDSGRRGGDRSDRTFRKDERDSDRPWKRTAAARDARKKRRF